MTDLELSELSTAEHVVEALRRRGTRLTGLPVGTNILSRLVAARIEGRSPDGFEDLATVDPDVAAEVVNFHGLVSEPSRSERSVYVLPERLRGDGASGDPPRWDENAPHARGVSLARRLDELSDLDEPADPPARPARPHELAMPDLDREPERLWAGIVDVTPELAEAWLERNSDNRPRRSGAVSRYRRLMDAGRWMVSTDAIGFDTTGKMVNGQHRVEGVIKHDAAQKMLVVTGLDPAVFAVLDGGTPRTGSDVLSIRGFEYASVVASVVRAAIFAKAGTLWTRGRAAPLELSELVEAAEADREALIDAARAGKRLWQQGRDSGDIVVAGLFAFAIYAYRLAGKGAEVERYLEAVATGIGITAIDDPAHVVRQAYLDDQRADVRMGRAERLAILLRGAQHAALGLAMPRARGKGAGAWPSPEVPGWPKQRNPVKARTAGTLAAPEIRSREDEELDEDDDA